MTNILTYWCLFIRDWNQQVILLGKGNIKTSPFKTVKLASYIDSSAYANAVADAGRLLLKESCATVQILEVIFSRTKRDLK